LLPEDDLPDLPRPEELELEEREGGEEGPLPYEARVLEYRSEFELDDDEREADDEDDERDEESRELLEEEELLALEGVGGGTLGPRPYCARVFEYLS